MDQDTKYSQATYEFGGNSQVFKDFSLDTVNYLYTFPGHIQTINLWLDNNESLDITQAGYIPNSAYSVLDKDYQFLYSVRNAINFGRDTKDIQLLTEKSHGEYFHVLFEGNKGKTVIVMWICKIPSPEMRESISEMWQSYYHSKIKGQINEIFVDLSEISSNKQIEIITYEANLDIGLTVKKIKELGTFSKFSAEYSVYLRPRVNTWYCFLVENVPLRVKGVVGEGNRQFIVNRDGLHHLTLRGRRHLISRVKLSVKLEES